MIEKHFFNKIKTITYNVEICLKAEKFFKTIQQVKLKGTSVKIMYVVRCILCLTCGVNTRRGTLESIGSM